MPAVKCLNPIANKSARVLVLNSMPGTQSLKAGQYYAHPRNAFWRIMADVYGFSAELPYEYRVAALTASGVALWDVLYACVRVGSLDSAIKTGSRIANDFVSFFQQHPDIRLVCFNGAEAERSFNAYVRARITVSGVNYVRLPSTSPAHAVSYEKKYAAWRAAICAHEETMSRIGS